MNTVHSLLALLAGAGVHALASKLPLLARAFTKGNIMSKNSIEALVAAVERDTTLKASAATLVKGVLAELAEVKAELASKGVDVTILDNLTAKLDAGSDALAAALEANTAPAPAPEVAPDAAPVADTPPAAAPTE